MYSLRYDQAYSIILKSNISFKLLGLFRNCWFPINNFVVYFRRSIDFVNAYWALIIYNVNTNLYAWIFSIKSPIMNFGRVYCKVKGVLYRNRDSFFFIETS